MAEGILSRFLSQPGQAQALMNMSAALMAGGAPSYDPGASGRAWGTAAQGYGDALAGAREMQLREQYRKAQLAELESETKERERKAEAATAAQRMLLGPYLMGEGPATGSVRAAQDEGVTGRGILAGFEGQQGDLLRGLAAISPEKATATALELSTKEAKPPTTREVKRGDQIVTQQWNPSTMKFEDIASANRFDQERPAATRFQAIGPYQDDSGNFLGEGVFDRQTGTTMLRVGTEMKPMPKGAAPRTEGAMAKNTMDANSFLKLASTAAEEERSLRALKNYMGNVKDSEQGYRLLADKFLAQMKTIFKKELTPEEYRTLLQSGQLQGLMGGFRKEVVGGGVMTEQDALRIIARLGGDLSATRNKEVAAGLIKELMQEKAREYNEVVVPTYNEQLRTTRRGAFKPKQPFTVEESWFQPSSQAPTEGWTDVAPGVRIREKR